MILCYEIEANSEKDVTGHESLDVSGSTPEVEVACARLISLVHARLLKHNKPAAAKFRLHMMVAVCDPHSPVWPLTPDEAVGNVTDISVVIPKPRKE